MVDTHPILTITFVESGNVRQEYELSFLADIIGRIVPRRIIGLFTGNLRRSIQAIARKMEAATPEHDYAAPDRWTPEIGTWRSYYPGGERLKGPHIRQNWDAVVGRADDDAAAENQAIGSLVNWHPGAGPLMFGSAGGVAQTLVEPHYLNPAIGRVPKLLRLGRGTTDESFRAAVATRSPGKENLEMQDAFGAAISQYGGASFHAAILEASRQYLGGG